MSGIVVGSVAVEIVPSTRGFKQKMAADLRNLSVNVEAKVDDAAAKAELDVLSRDREVNLNVDKNGAGRLALSGATAGIAALGAAAAGLGPAIVPVAAVLTGAIGGLSVPLAAATAGLGSFALFAIPAFTKITDASTKLAAAQLRVTNAVTSKQRQTALLKEQQLLAQLSPAQRAAVVSLNSLKDAFKGFQAALAPQIFGVFNAGIGAAKALLPSLAALAKATAPALISLANSLAAAFKGPEFKAFVAFLAAQAGPAIKAFASILGNLAVGFARMLPAFAPVGKTLIDGLVKLTAGFANLAKSKGFQSFIAYVIANMPAVGKIFGDLFRIVGSALAALAGPGAVALGVIGDIVHAVAAAVKHAPILAGVLGILATALIPFVSGPVALVAAAIFAIGAAFKYVYDHSAPLRDYLHKLGVVMHDLAVKAFPVLKKIVGEVAGGIRKGVAIIGDAIASHKPQLESFLRGIKTFGEFLIRDILPKIGPVLVVAIGVLASGIAVGIAAISGLVTAFIHVKNAVRDMANGIRTGWDLAKAAFIVARSVIGTIVARVRDVVNGLWASIRAVFAAGSAFVARIWSTLWNTQIGKLIRTVWGLVVRVVQLGWATISSVFTSSAGRVRSVTTSAFGTIRSIITMVMGVVRGVVSAAWAFITGVVSGAVGRIIAAVGRIQAIVAVVSGAFSAAYNAVASWLSRIVGIAGGIGGRIAGAVGNLGNVLYSAGQSVIQGLINGISSMIGSVTSTLSHITSLIPHVKGPPARDRMLLHDNGRLIMHGLIAGIRSEIPNLTGTLGSITGTIGGMRPAQVNLAGAGAGGGGYSPTVQLNARTVDVTSANIRPLIDASLLHARLGRPR